MRSLSLRILAWPLRSAVTNRAGLDSPEHQVCPLESQDKIPLIHVIFWFLLEVFIAISRCITGYLSPEVLKKEPYGKPVDIWACGTHIVTSMLYLNVSTN